MEQPQAKLLRKRRQFGQGDGVHRARRIGLAQPQADGDAAVRREKRQAA
jgi:hypothetical protein